MEFCTLYVTCADAEEARRIGLALVEERLAACANIVPAIESVYRWQGRVVQGGEALLFAKTRAELVEQAIARVKALHFYEVPCVVALPILAGNADYLAWMAEST